MTERERFIQCFTFGRPDRLPFQHSFGLMPGVLDRWHREGLPASVDEAGIAAHFGFGDRAGGLPVNMGPRPPFEPAEREVTGGVRVFRDAKGVWRRLKESITTLGIPFEFPIKNAADWAEYKPRLQYCPERIAADLKERHAELREKGLPIRVGATGFYWMPRDLMGDENLCLSYYTQPDLVRDIARTYAAMVLAVSEEVLSQVEVDSFHMGEDMCYRNAMMVSPAVFREFMMPHYKQLIDLYRAHGTRVFSVDTDGHLGQLIPLLIEAGVNLVGPCEVQAGNDVVEMRARYGERMAFFGGLNKRALADKPVSLVPDAPAGRLTARQAIEQELQYRLPPMLEMGGYRPGLDHRVVPETSLASFTHYVRRAREMLGMDLDVPALQRKSP